MTARPRHRSGGGATGATATPTGNATGARGAEAGEPTIADLLARIQAMEAELAALRATVAADIPEHLDVPGDATIPEDVVIAISAAVAAYLGKRAKVRQIHLAGDTTWAREGRAYVHSVHSASRRR